MGLITPSGGGGGGGAPAAHAADHSAGGPDAVSLQNLAGAVTDARVPNLQDLSGVVTDAQVPDVSALSGHTLAVHDALGLGRDMNPGALPMNIGAAPVAWVNQPAAENFWNGNEGQNVRGADLTMLTDVRLVGRATAAGAAGALVVLAYSVDDGAGWADLATASIAAVGNFDTGWTALPAPAQAADVWLAIRGRDGDAVADPAIHIPFVLFR